MTVIVVVSLFAFFFFAPVAYWFSSGPGFYEQNPPHWNIYRSLSCVTLGVGVTYSQSPYYGGLRLSCSAPPLPNATAIA